MFLLRVNNSWTTRLTAFIEFEPSHAIHLTPRWTSWLKPINKMWIKAK